MHELELMLDTLAGARPEVMPSKFWVELNKRNLTQLALTGYENFKRTLALNYFTWMLDAQDGQFRFLEQHNSATVRILDGVRTWWTQNHEHFGKTQSRAYNRLTHSLWSYATRMDTSGILTLLEEPTEGNPPRVYRGGKLISQDLANSALEYLSMVRGGVEPAETRTVLELGAGYGRTAYVFSKLLPNAKYVIVDIPPALYVCQRYLSAVLPKKKVFRFRPFAEFEEIRDEYERADVVCLLANQLELLPNKSVDLSINISSLHEMRPEQIAYYFGELERVTRGHFYFKQWKSTVVPFENIPLTENDYPVPSTWERLFWRECPVQTYFFEALLRLPQVDSTTPKRTVTTSSDALGYEHRPLPALVE